MRASPRLARSLARACVVLAALAIFVGGAGATAGAPVSSSSSSSSSSSPAMVAAGDDDPDIAPAPLHAAPPPELPRFVDDLAGLRRRGVLRVLVQGHGEDLLPRDGASTRLDRELVERFARKLGLAPAIVAVARFDDLLPALLEGRGDVIAGRLTVTDERKRAIAFSRPTRIVDEVLVGRAAVPGPAAIDALGALDGLRVAVLKGSSHEATLRARTTSGHGPTLVVVDDERDEHDLAADVAAGAVAATVIDSDVLAHVRAYNDGVAPWGVVAKGRALALGLRPKNPQLKAALDAFLVENALTAHRDDARAQDLDGIRERGSLRVLTRNDPVSYLLHKGEQRGFDYELLLAFAASERLRVDVVVPPRGSDLLPWLQQGRGDVVAALLPDTPALRATTSLSAPYLWGDEVLVQRRTTKRAAAGARAKTKAPSPGTTTSPPTWSAALAGRVVHVASGAHARALLDGAAREGQFTVVVSDDDPTALLAAVAAGTLDAAVVAGAQARAFVAAGEAVEIVAVVADDVPSVFAVRPEAAQLQAALNAFVRGEVSRDGDGRVRGSAAYNGLRRAFIERPLASSRPKEARQAGRISAWDALLQRRAAEVGLDWRLLAAQAYQESHFDPLAKSWVGAQGLFQVMPSTGKELGFTNLTDPDEGVHAGARYMAWLLDQFDARLPFKQRVRFALAAYNAGKGHVDDARRLAKEMGLDPDKWFKHTERAMLRLADPQVARRMRYGYCRGSEPVKYVSEIQSRYDSYTTLVPAVQPR